MNPNSSHARDIAYQIHPQTNFSLHEKIGPTVMTRGDGFHVYDDAGNRYLEAMAGLWCAALGFSEDRLAQAAAKQFAALPYYQNFAHRTSEPAIELSERLIRLAPVPMSKVLFQSSGSEANDTAVKLAWYYFHAIDQPQKRKIISRKRSYHGTSIASASLTALPHIHRDFNLPLDGFLHVTCPHFYREGLPGETEDEFATRLATEIEDLILREGPETVAAFFAEPVMGTGGCVVPPKGYYEKVQAVLARHDVLFVVDEVICGFGRTGNWWGSQTFDLRPDMITSAKALTAAYQPLSALLLSERIYQAMKVQADKIGVFGHGYTYGGHPVACAVALEALTIYEERGLIAGSAALGRHLESRLAALLDHPLVGEVRGIGMMWGVELVRSKATRAPFEAASKVGLEIQRLAFERGLIVRALGDTLVFTPPLVITPAGIDDAVDRFHGALDAGIDLLPTLGAALDTAA